MPIRKKLAITAGAMILGTGLALGGSLVAHADPSGVHVIYNKQGEAGYYANSNGQTRFRDVQAQVTVTNGIKNLNGTGSNDGAVGVELCNPNTDYSVQLGVLWNGSR